MKKSRLLLYGLLLIILGLIILLTNFKIISFSFDLLKFWPLLFIWLGLELILKFFFDNK